MSEEAGSVGGDGPAPREPTEGQIAHRAYHIWRWLGCPEGYSDAIWDRARRELIAGLNGEHRSDKERGPDERP